MLSLCRAPRYARLRQRQLVTPLLDDMPLLDSFSYYAAAIDLRYDALIV